MRNRSIPLPEGHQWKEETDLPGAHGWFCTRCDATFAVSLDDGELIYDEGDGSCAEETYD